MDWTKELEPDECGALIDKIAFHITARGLETPAILFLEMHKPLAFIAGQGMVVGSPFIGPFIGIENVQKISKLIEKRENVERLIQRIEDMAEERRAVKDSKRRTKSKSAK